MPDYGDDDMNLAIIGGGPAGLRAAEVASEGGAKVQLFDAMPSVGRKLLVAGKGGLNLTKEEPRERMAARYSGEEQPKDVWSSLLHDFDTAALRAWVHGLGVETFVGTSNRIFPHEMKAAPFLRHWVHRLHKQNVQFFMRHRWHAIRKGFPIVLEFLVDKQIKTVSCDVAILALGGASWPKTGSTAQWVTILSELGVKVIPLKAANCGWEVDWSRQVVSAVEGEPLKNLIVRAGDTTIAGELLITRYGLEGGVLYQLGTELRAMENPELSIDFKMPHTVSALVGKMGSVHRSCLAMVRQRLKLSDSAFAVLSHVYGSETWYSSEDLAHKIKNCTIPLVRSRPLDEAISTAGGICWSELNNDLMLTKYPGIFVCGEMIDWEAPTGGYLIHGCLAMGARAAKGALAFLQK